MTKFKSTAVELHDNRLTPKRPRWYVGLFADVRHKHTDLSSQPCVRELSNIDVTHPSTHGGQHVE